MVPGTLKTLFLTVMFTTLSASANAAENAKNGVCSNSDGVCGCSYGRFVCCDGSYAPVYSWTGGRLVSHECSTSANLGNQPIQRVSHDPQSPDVTQPGQIPLSHEGFWKRSVFDR